MVPKVTVIIPTYARILKETGCLVNLLESLRHVNDKRFRVILLNTTNPPDTSVEEIVSRLIVKYKKFYPIMTTSLLDLWKVHEFLEEKGYDLVKDQINLDRYSNFRNYGLIIANILKSSLVLFIDDDEVVTDKDFFKIVRDGLGEKFKGRKVYGKTGYYINGTDEYVLKINSGVRKKLWPSVDLINRTMTTLVESPSRYSLTTMALGGIMTLTDKLYMTVPFDPYCRRGEDSNYMISCKHFGMRFVFDNLLHVDHNPPNKHSDFYKRFREDIFRFVYERERIQNLNVDVEDLDPYPGFFLREDMEYRAASVCINYASRARTNGKTTFFNGHMKNMEILFKAAPDYAIAYASKYIRFQKKWIQLMRDIRQSKELYTFFNKF